MGFIWGLRGLLYIEVMLKTFIHLWLKVFMFRFRNTHLLPLE